MRIGFMLYGSIHTLTGGFLYDRYLVDFLRDRGHDVRLWSLPARRYPWRLADNLDRACIERVAAAGCDLLIQDELCHPSLFGFNPRFRRKSRIPIVSVVHHLNCREPRHPMLNVLLALPEKYFLNSVDGFIFNSRTTQQNVARLCARRRPFVVAPPGGDRFKKAISAEHIDRRARLPGPLRLLFLGLVIERKGLRPLIEALSRIPPAIWQLEVVGDLTRAPRYVRRVRQMIRDRGLSARVGLWGTLPTRALTQRLAESHLLCMPFAYEGFGIATLEALHFGVPVLGAHAGATRELIQHGRNGLLFEDHDLGAVAEAIQELHVDRERLARMSAAAMASAQSHPSWQSSLQRIERFLLQLAGRCPEAGGLLAGDQGPGSKSAELLETAVDNQSG